MMKHNLTIDGVNALTQYGVSVISKASGTYYDLIQYPSLKNVEYNDWKEEDGLQVDLSAVYLSSRDVSFQMVGNSMNGVKALFSDLSDDSGLGIGESVAYHDFGFLEIGRTYRLRLNSESSRTVFCNGYTLFTLKLTDDTPISSSYSYSPPQFTLNLPNQNVYLDGINLRQYGITLVSGYKAECLKAPETKQNLYQNFSNLNGAIYDDAFVYYKDKDVKISGFMLANTKADFWRNYDALIYNLSRANKRILSVDGTDYDCYYKSCSVSAFRTASDITWMKFTLTLCFYNYRPTI
jgi:hypothetical protein